MHLNREFRKKLRKAGFYSALILILFVILVVMKINLIGIILSFILFIAACLSKFYKMFTHISFGFELVTFTTFLFAYVYGVGFAIAACILMLLISGLLSSKLKFPNMAVQIICYFIGILIVAFVPGNFYVLVSIAIIVRIVLMTLSSVILLGINFVELGIYVLGNTILNYIILFALGPFFLRALT